MRCRYLGWAGVELEHEGATLVIDPLADPGATFAAVGDAAAGITLPAIASPQSGAVAGLVTHLHRDHADAGALQAALAPGAPVYGPGEAPGGKLVDSGLLQARAELAAAGIELSALEAWQSAVAGPFTITALPAADGTGDPQVSWAVEAGGRRVVHCGDTLFHGWWWRTAQALGPVDAAFVPINGARLDFPWRQPPSPLPGVMDPEQAAAAAAALGARRAVPMHFGAFDLDPFYRSVADAPERFARAADGVAAPLEVGATLDL